MLQIKILLFKVLKGTCLICFYFPYLYSYGASYDLAARRKNATRESTATLKAWLNEHKKNPYPTKGEKIMLAIITKMTLTQVSTWFANARRRLKKENKMTWEPKNRTDDDDDALVSDDEKDKEDMEPSKGNQSGGSLAKGKGLGKDSYSLLWFYSRLVSVLNCFLR